MEGIECLSLSEDGLDINPVLSYISAQLHHHEVIQMLLTNPPLRALRGKYIPVGAEMSYSTSMASLGSAPKLRQTPAHHLLRRSILLHPSLWTPANR
jgi:hypothetical protein